MFVPDWDMTTSIFIMACYLRIMLLMTSMTFKFTFFSLWTLWPVMIVFCFPIPNFVGILFLWTFSLSYAILMKNCSPANLICLFVVEEKLLPTNIPPLFSSWFCAFSLLPGCSSKMKRKAKILIFSSSLYFLSYTYVWEKGNTSITWRIPMKNIVGGLGGCLMKREEGRRHAGTNLPASWWVWVDFPEENNVMEFVGEREREERAATSSGWHVCQEDRGEVSWKFAPAFWKALKHAYKLTLYRGTLHLWLFILNITLYIWKGERRGAVECGMGWSGPGMACGMYGNAVCAYHGMFSLKIIPCLSVYKPPTPSI